MALERICGIDKADFMQPYNDLNVAYAQVEVNTGKTVFDSAYSVIAPPFENPKRKIKRSLKKSNLNLEMSHGTTTLGFKYQGGILLCADSRGTNGEFIASQEMKKIIEVDKGILGTIAGGAADCVYWDRVLTMECRLFELTYGRSMTVKSAARIMCNIAYKFKGLGLCIGMMLAGYDFDGPQLIYVDSDGQRVEGNLFTIGSGAHCALGILDSFYRWDMSDEEAYNLALRGVYHATYLDAYTGGLVRLYHMRPHKWSIVTVKDCMELGEIFAKAQKENPTGGPSSILRKGFKADPEPEEEEVESVETKIEKYRKREMENAKNKENILFS
ncbi:uncharacterized protein Dvir_GJ16567 [Drosophila virilis]|uniref:proteasome endopeptidase complex n=1 Tax=Drosophila virilis TaxID=7244 RepID=B4M6V9_DROVI|nr:proteasome subunit beta type-5 [Drosophila virilis]EDW62526.1 uncharacterized protein Dvir_GJ16567 [Drosophila virilis]